MRENGYRDGAGWWINENALYTTGFFTIGTLGVIVTSVNKGEARKGKKT